MPRSSWLQSTGKRGRNRERSSIRYAKGRRLRSIRIADISVLRVSRWGRSWRSFWKTRDRWEVRLCGKGNQGRFTAKGAKGAKEEKNEGESFGGDRIASAIYLDFHLKY